MAVLPRAGQGNSPGYSPRHRGCGRGRTDRTTSSCPNSQNGQTGVGQTASACNVSVGCRTATTGPHQGNAQGPKDGQGNTSNKKDSSSLQCVWCQGWGLMAWECATPANLLNQKAGTKECVPTSHQQQPTVDLQHSLPDPEPNPTLLKAVWKKGWPEVTPVPFINPDPVACLVGCSNEAPVIIDGQETMALIDSGTQVSRVSSQFCEELALEIQPLDQLLELEGKDDAAILYLGFVEVNLQIPGIQHYNEDVLLLVIPTTTYSQTVTVVVGSKMIDKALSVMTKGELKKAATMWRQAHFGAVMSG